MTVKHMLDGLVQATGASSLNQCSELLGQPKGTLWRLYVGQRATLKVTTLLSMSEMSRTPAATLIEWYQLPEGAVLGRVKFTLWEK